MTDRTDRPGADTENAESSGLDSAEVFSLLGNETRLEIVTALHDDAGDGPVPFSELYDDVALTDSAQFNYHLKRLVPHFVSKGDDGYELTSAGRRLAQAVVAGTYTDDPRLDPFEIDGCCYACDDPALQAAYADDRFRIDCRSCGAALLRVRVPPTVVRGREPSAVVDAFDRWSRAQGEQAQRGICPDCGGAVEPSVVEETDEEDPFDAVAAFDCTVCGRRILTSFGGIASRSPDVESFLREREESLRDRPYWEIGQLIAGEHTEIVSREPWLVRVSFFADDDACRVEIDGDLEIVETEIVRDGYSEAD